MPNVMVNAYLPPAPPVPVVSGYPVPGLASAMIGDPRSVWSDPNLQYRCSLDSIVVAGLFDGFDNGAATQTSEQVFTAIKVLSPTTKCIKYNDPLYQSTTYAMPNYNYANTYRLLAYDSAAPPWTPVNYGGAEFAFNLTIGGPTDPAGRTCPQWQAAYTLDFAINGNSAGLGQNTNYACPACDGVYYDDEHTVTPNGDFARRGNPFQVQPDDSIAFRQGIRNLWDTTRTFKSGVFVMGNTSYDSGYIGGVQSRFAAPEWSGGLDGEMVETFLGDIDSLELTVPSFLDQVNYIQFGLNSNATSSTGVRLFNHVNLRSDGSDPLTWNGNYSSPAVTAWSPAWQGLRHGLAMQLVMFDGLYVPCATGTLNQFAIPSAAPYSPQYYLWFDQFSVNLATGVAVPYLSARLGQGYLGPWVDPPQTIPTQNGMYRRRATHGEVWVNPRGNGAQTASFGRTLRLITALNGSDPTLTGGTATSYPLGDRDGFIGLY